MLAVVRHIERIQQRNSNSFLAHRYYVQADQRILRASLAVAQSLAEENYGNENRSQDRIWFCLPAAVFVVGSLLLDIGILHRLGAILRGTVCTCCFLSKHARLCEFANNSRRLCGVFVARGRRGALARCSRRSWYLSSLLPHRYSGFHILTLCVCSGALAVISALVSTRTVRKSRFKF